jgi:hypothetical protein
MLVLLPETTAAARAALANFGVGPSRGYGFARSCDLANLDYQPRAARFSRLAARFSSSVFAGFFLLSFFLSMPLLMMLSDERRIAMALFQPQYYNIENKSVTG